MHELFISVGVCQASGDHERVVDSSDPVTTTDCLVLQVVLKHVKKRYGYAYIKVVSLI